MLSRIARRVGLKRRQPQAPAVVEVLATLRPRLSVAPLVRLGGAADGGYLVPDDLDGITACFSPGVAGTADFELDMARRGIPSYMADASVSGPPVTSDLLHFTPKFLGSQDRGEFITLESWVSQSAPVGDLLLQMDIEGAEYEVLLSTPAEVLRRFRIVVLELHSLDHLFDPFSRQMMKPALAKLTDHFDVVHAHPNNVLRPRVREGVALPMHLEVTFLRKDRAGARKTFATQFPHPLDRDNIPWRKTSVLPPALIGQA